ncbi:hypothetical protein RB601_000793 [Gaeumannomyces tritici]
MPSEKAPAGAENEANQPCALGTGHAKSSSDGVNDSDHAKSSSDGVNDSDTTGIEWNEERRNNLVADWKFMDFEHFKNRHGPDEGMHIIEALRAHPYIEEEIWKETRDRGMRWKSTEPRMGRGFKTDHEGGQETEHVQRIRIQSPALILMLSRLTGHGDSWNTDRPRTFLRPFRTMYYYRNYMKDILTMMEKRFGAPQTGMTTPDAKPAPGVDAAQPSDQEDGSESDFLDLGEEDFDEPDLDEVVSGDIANTATALQHVRKYLEFVDKHILPQWEAAQGIEKKRAAFLDLWMSFTVGEMLYRPPTVDPPKLGDKKSQSVKKTDQSVWRLYSINQDMYEDGPPDDYKVNKRRGLYLHAYYIDYDGARYQPVRDRFNIQDYEGERDITEFPIYPLRFAKDSTRLMRNFMDQGRQFQLIKTEKYLYYDGWTLTRGPTSRDEDSNELTSEHIDGSVIVDFLEGYKADPPLGQPAFEGLVRFKDVVWLDVDDPMEIRHWLNDKRQGSPYTLMEKTQRSEFFGIYLVARHMKESKFMRCWKAGNSNDLDGDDLALLPRRAVAFALRERKFILADINMFRMIPRQQDVFKDLKIDPKHKQMIESLVKTHFEKQAMQKAYGTGNLNQDLIRGKGSGLFMLLHGVPGVGKTATAEAIAQVNSKPLFAITCGDLGFEAGKVDASLRNIFRLAHLWDCVLLLDEADVFLSRREVYDLKRNALVSVFLRVLEYYSGILFLTTNRVGHLDEAFKSRIHVSLYYPPLTIQQTVAIFDVNIRQLEMIEAEKQRLMSEEGSVVPKRPKMIIDKANLRQYAEWHWRAHEQWERWNGRQIRNAFQIAYSLAHSPENRPAMDGQGRVISQAQLRVGRPQPAAVGGDNPMPAGAGDQALERPLKLDYTQFEEVANVIEKFDNYLYDTLAGTATDAARDAGMRADLHNHTAQRPDRFLPQPRPAYPPSQRQQQAAGGFRPRQRQQRFTPDQPAGGAGPAAGGRCAPANQQPLRPYRTPGAREAPRGGGTPPQNPRRDLPLRQQQQQRRGAGLAGPGRARDTSTEASSWQNDGGFGNEAGDWGLQPQGGEAGGGEDYGSSGYNDNSGAPRGGQFGGRGGYYNEHDEFDAGMDDLEHGYENDHEDYEGNCATEEQLDDEYGQY